MAKYSSSYHTEVQIFIRAELKKKGENPITIGKWDYVRYLQDAKRLPMPIKVKEIPKLAKLEEIIHNEYLQPYLEKWQSQQNTLKS